MDVVEVVPSFEQYAFTFGGVAPLRRIAPGTALRLWSDDAFCGALRVGHRPVEREGRPALRQPADRPVLRRGRRAGRHPGAALRRPGAGPRLGRLGGDPVLRRADQHRPGRRPCRTPLPDTTWIYELDRARNTVTFAARHSDLRIDLPVEPMLGTVGVAPAGGEVRSSLVPDRFGGNMDTPQMRAGTTCFLGVNVEGALFSVGDGHYRQGEGEACGTAVEGAMTTTLIVELIKGGAPALAAARGRHPLDDRRVEPAARGRLADRRRPSWCAGSGELYGLHPMDAYQLLSQITRGADRQRRRRELQRRRQGPQVPAAAGDGVRRPARRPAQRARRPCSDRWENRHGPAADRLPRARHRGHPRHRPGDRRGVRRRGRRRRVLRARRRGDRGDREGARRPGRRACGRPARRPATARR